MKILIVKRDKLGDLLLTTPMLQVLRYALPAAEIHLLVPTYSSWILDNADFVDRVWSYPRVRTGRHISLPAAFRQFLQTRELRAQKFDWAIAGGGEHSHRAIKRLLSIKADRTIAAAKSADEPGISHPVIIGNEGHEALRIARLLEPLGLSVPRDVRELPPVAFAPSEAMKSSAKDWMAQQGVASGEYWVLGLGARRRKKQPSADQILRWAEYMFERHRLKTVFMWTPGKSSDPLYPGDDEVAEPVLTKAPGFLLPFRGALAPAIGLVWGARTSVFPDSGLMHFAAASPGGVLGLFADIEASPTPEQWGPLGKKSAYLAAPKQVAELEDREVYLHLDRLAT